MGEPKASGELTEGEPRDFVGEEASGERQGVEALVSEQRAAVSVDGGLEERVVEAHVVADDDRTTDEFEERGQHCIDRRRPVHDGVGETGEDRHVGRDGAAGVDEGLKRSEDLSATDLHRADLGDAAGGR